MTRRGFAKLLDGELRGGESGLGKQPGRRRLVCGDREAVAAADCRGRDICASRTQIMDARPDNRWALPAWLSIKSE
jgi:hypothetical protein